MHGASFWYTLHRITSPLPEYAPPIESLKVIKIDWEKTSPADLQKLRQEWVGMFNP